MRFGWADGLYETRYEQHQAGAAYMNQLLFSGNGQGCCFGQSHRKL